MKNEHINLLLTRLDEQQRRWYVATLAEQLAKPELGAEARLEIVAQVRGLLAEKRLDP